MLRALERAKSEYGPGWATRKIGLLAVLARASLRSAGEVERLHETLLFMRAYPDDRRVLATTERLLGRFERRADFKRHRDALADSGIRGTRTHYAFFWPTARWLARCAPGALRFDRDDRQASENIGEGLALLVTPAEAAWLAERRPEGFAALDRMRGRATDATFLLARIDAMPGDPYTRESFHDRVNASYVLDPARGTPERTLARFAGAPIAFQRRHPDRGRPVLAQALTRAPVGVRQVGPAEGERLIDLARGAMVSRARDLDAFAYGSRDDVVIVDDGEGLLYAFNGVTPDRRNLFPAIYGGLTIRNGIPIGYAQFDVLGAWAAVSFNTFSTYRGGEAAFTLGRMLAATHRVFGTTTFSVEPYQLGDGNDEGLDTGAWWFYYKHGFRPVAAGVRRLMQSELGRMRVNPAHRSSRRTLEQLAKAHVFWHFDRARAVGLPRLAELGAATADRLSGAVAADGARPGAFDDAHLGKFGLRSMLGWTGAEREAWARWSPMLAALPGFNRWPRRERRALVEVVRAKAARREIDFLRAFARHSRLSTAVFAK